MNTCGESAVQFSHAVTPLNNTWREGKIEGFEEWTIIVRHFIKHSVCKVEICGDSESEERQSLLHDVDK